MTLQPAVGTGKSVRVLLVEDYELWQVFLSKTLEKLPGLELVGTISDGSLAVQKAEALQPDLILLDIALPSLNGIEAARRICKVCPNSKILFVTENRAVDVAEEALSAGAVGYVVKSDAESDLLPAVKAVLEGKRFISASLAGQFLVATTLSTTLTSQLSWILGLISGTR
jgi:DNA-binding NarL/FixJ family response regulator